MNITRNLGFLHAAADIHEIAPVLRQTTEALATASALLTDLVVSAGAFPAINAATVELLDALKAATGAIDAGRSALLNAADGLAFGDGEAMN